MSLSKNWSILAHRVTWSPQKVEGFQRIYAPEKCPSSAEGKSLTCWFLSWPLFGVGCYSSSCLMSLCFSAGWWGIGWFESANIPKIISSIEPGRAIWFLNASLRPLLLPLSKADNSVPGNVFNDINLSLISQSNWITCSNINTMTIHIYCLCCFIFIITIIS